MYRRLVAKLTLVTFVATLALPIVSSQHLKWDDDLDGGSLGLASAHRHQAFESVTAQPPANHCALCHWLRDMAAAEPSQIASPALSLAPRMADVQAPLSWLGQLVPVDRPSRAPPVLDLL